VCDDAGAANQRYAVAAADGVGSGGVDAGVKEDPAANRSKSNAPGEESEKKERGKSLNKALVPIVRVLLLNLADTARIRARELGNRRTEEEEGRNRGRRRKKQQNTIGGRFQFVFFIARSSPVYSYIVHYKASWTTKRPMAGDNNFGPKPETVRNGLLRSLLRYTVQVL